MKFAYRHELGVTTNRGRLLRKTGRDGFGDYVAPELKPTEAAWLAAMIDGEGFISFRRNAIKGYLFPVVAVCNTHDGLIARIRELVGEKWTLIKFGRQTTTCKAVQQIAVRRVAIGDVLRQVRPYLIAKGRQADLLLQFTAMHDALPVRSPPQAEYAGWFDEIRSLNKRGPS